MRAFLVALFLPAVLLARDPIGQAQPPLPTIDLRIGTHRVVAEVADDPEERAAGLMFRESVPDGTGMLFVMPTIDAASFWMKNTPHPLSIAFISLAGIILEIHDLTPHEVKPVRSRFKNVAYALEVRQGWFSDSGIFAGDRVEGLPPHPATSPRQ